MRPADMIDMNGLMPVASARRAAWLLAGFADTEAAPFDPAAISPGEAERLELADAIAFRLKGMESAPSLDAGDLAMCRRLLRHLSGPRLQPLRLQ